MDHEARRISITLSLIALCSAPHALAGEITVGNVRLQFSEMGAASIYYRNAQVIRSVYLYFNAKDKTLTYDFPGRYDSMARDPQIKTIKDKAGRETARAVTWRFNSAHQRITGLAPEAEQFVRMTVAANRVTIEMHAEPENPGLSGYGEVGIYVPEAAYLGGAYSARSGDRRIFRELTPANEPMDSSPAMSEVTFETEQGRRMRMALKQHRLTVQDFRLATSAKQKATFRVVTTHAARLAEVLTIEFTDPPPDP